MVTISIYDHPPQIVIHLQNPLSDSRVEQLARLWKRMKAIATDPIVVDLSSVTCISNTGFQLLKRMYAEGAKMIVFGPVPHPFPQPA